MVAPKRFDPVERRITRAFRALERDWTLVDPPDRACTRALKDRIGSIGARLDFKVYSTACKFEKNGEWLFDMTWVKERRDGSLFRIPLVLACEWTPTRARLSDDFEKLIAARADHRVFVFWSRTLATARRETDGLVERVAGADLANPGDRYLFACWTDESDRFETTLYVAPRAARRRRKR